MIDLPVRIRQVRDTDHALILDSWVGILLYKTPGNFWIPNGLTVEKYRQMISRLLEDRPELFSLVVNEDDEDQIFGWRCGERRVSHFVFVKREFREMGLASLLCGNYEQWIFTHWTKDCEKIGKLIYKPSLFKELINEINRPLGDSSPETDKLSGQERADVENRQSGQAVSEAVGMVS